MLCWQLWRKLGSKVLGSASCSVVKASVRPKWESPSCCAKSVLIPTANTLLSWLQYPSAHVTKRPVLADLLLIPQPAPPPRVSHHSQFSTLQLQRKASTEQPISCLESTRGRVLGTPWWDTTGHWQFCFVFWGDPALPGTCNLCLKNARLSGCIVVPS